MGLLGVRYPLLCKLTKLLMLAGRQTELAEGEETPEFGGRYSVPVYMNLMRVDIAADRHEQMCPLISGPDSVPAGQSLV